MYPIRTCKCGHEHECSRLDPIENGKLRHALAREIGRVPPEKRGEARKALAAAMYDEPAPVVRVQGTKPARAVSAPTDYRCLMHRKDTKGCGYCDIEHRRMAND